MLKNISLTSLISLVSLTSVIIGFLIGYSVKQPAADFAEKLIEEKIAKPLNHIIEFREGVYQGTELYFSFSILSGMIEAIEQEPTNQQLAKKMITDYLSYKLPKVEKYCAELYSGGRAYSECFADVEKVKVQIAEQKAHKKCLMDHRFHQTHC